MERTKVSAKKEKCRKFKHSFIFPQLFLAPHHYLSDSKWEFEYSHLTVRFGILLMSFSWEFTVDYELTNVVVVWEIICTWANVLLTCHRKYTFVNNFSGKDRGDWRSSFCVVFVIVCCINCSAIELLCGSLYGYE
jgi:hypothetical protein